MIIKKIKELGSNAFPLGSFRTNVLTFMAGTAIAQLITVSISPVLTRLFTPKAFGVFGVYLSIVSIFTAIATLRYDQALMLPKESKDAAHLFWASLVSVFGTSVLTLFVCLLFLNKIIMILKIPEIGPWILFLPFSILLAGAYLTLNSWSTRQKRFKRASVSQVIRSSTISSVQVASGIIKTGPVGLIFGAVLGDLFATIVLAFQVKHDDEKILNEGLHWQSIKELGKQYSDFPVFSSTQNFLNAISQNIPVLLLAKFFGPAVVGFYAFGVRVIQLPMNLVLTSLREVLFQKASEVYNAGGNVYVLFKKTTLGLITVAILPAMIIILWGPEIFGYVLGKGWIMAGVYSRWLVLWLMCGFSNLPAVLFAQIFRKQKIILIQDIFLLLFRALAIVSGSLRNDPLLAVILYSLVGVFFNTFIIVWMGIFLRNIQKRNERNNHVLNNEF